MLKFQFFSFFFCLFSFVLILQAFGQNVRPPELAKGDRGAMLKGERISSPKGRSAVQSTGRMSEYRRALRRVILPGVRRLVPQEYPTIQTAIDACVDGDTVLISEGTYLENIRYKGKAIVVTSLYLIDGDTTHIPQTIIDGSNPLNPDSGSVVYFIDGEDTTSVLCGLTIRGGTGTPYNIGGNWYRSGGGVFCESAGPRLTRNLIVHNRIVSNGAIGGGVAVLENTQILLYCIIEYNHLSDNFLQANSTDLGGDGGGITIADISSGGISSRIIGNVVERDTILALNWADGGGLSLWKYANVGVYPEANIQGNIFRANILNATNSSANGAGMFIAWTGEVTILENLFENNVATSTSDYADGGGLCIYDGNITGYGRKMVIRNRIINNRTNVSGSGGDSNGGGIHLNRTLATISGNEITDNRATAPAGLWGFGGGICIDMTSFRMENNFITRNYSSGRGGGVDVWEVPQQGIDQLLVNNTIFDNNAQFGGGGLGVANGANVIALNNILWSNNEEIRIVEARGSIHYCDIQGGWPGIGNIDIDPQFADTLFHLLPNSHCIGMGRSEMTLGDTTYHAPAFDLEGNPRPNPIDTLVDMGAYETPFPARAHIVKSMINQGSGYIHPCQDSVRILVQILDPHQQGVTLAASMSNLQGAIWDEFPLYNDGQHGDSLAGDYLFGAILPPVMLEDAFRFSYLLANSTFQDTMSFQGKQQVTSIGPLICEDYHILSQDSNRIKLELELCNLGLQATAAEVQAELIPCDSTVVSIYNNQASFGNIPAGGTAVNSTAYIIDTIENPGTILFDVRISMGGYPYWLQERLVVGIEPVSQQLPREYALYQNYPNPFNPSTVISWQLAVSSRVKLSLYNIAGQEVAVLVDNEQKAGSHQVEFDASGLASGIYVYRLSVGSRTGRAGNFVESRKMLLLR